jgi:hydrogenase expression/formation protein HypC
MCIALPGKIARIFGNPLLPMATVEYGAVTKECCLAYVPEAAVGDYVLVQSGFAMSLLETQEALQILAAFREIGLLGADPGATALSTLGETCTSWP